jgi:hypothetical protein
MPAIIPIIAALATSAAFAAGATVATAFGLSAFAGTVIGLVLATGAAAFWGFVANALSPRAKSAAGKAQERKQTIRSSIAPRQIVYGTARVSGPIVYATSTGSKKEFLHIVVPLAGHRVNAPLALWINDERIPWSEINAGGFVTRERYATPTTSEALLDLINPGGASPMRGLVRVRFFNGSQTTAASELITETDGAWTSAHILRETAYMYLRLEFNRDVFANGPGALSMEVQGHSQITDPRTSAVGWSDNPALCILHYLKSADGLACADDEIDLASFITAANVCDENVTIAVGVTQRRYTLDGIFNLEQKPLDIIDDMLTACAGTLVYVAGRYRLHAGAYDAPTDTLTASDLAGSLELVTKPPRREIFNTLRGTFISPERNWQATEFPPFADASLIAADGEVIERDIEWPFTTDATRAQRLAKLTLRRAREALTVRVPVKYSGIRYTVWQTLNVTLADFGWTDKPFRVVSWTFDAAAGIVNLTLREESPNSYAWVFGDAADLPFAPDTDLVDPLLIPAPTNVTLTATTVLQADGSVAPALLVTWTASAFAFLIGHEVQWRVTGTEDWNSAQVPLDTNRFVIAPVVVGTSYDVRVRGVTGLARGPWSAIFTASGAADSTPPDAPTSLAATGITRGISVSWTMPSAFDLAAVEVWENTSSSPTGRYFVGETRGTGFLRTGLNPNTTRHYWVRSRDLSGNLSAYVGPVSATSTLALVDDIADGILNTAKFAASIRPVEIVSSLPSSGNTQGRTVFLTTDNKLYRWTGSAWTAAVPALDLTGQITTTQITDGAVSTPKLNAGAVTAEKIATNAITSDKITANSIIAGKIAAAAISTTELAAGAVRAVNLASETLITQAAQMGTAVINTAAIGDLQVNTIKIGGDAVTTHVSNVRVDAIIGDGTNQTVNEFSFSSPTARSGFVLVQIDQGYPGSGRNWIMSVILNGVTIRSLTMGGGLITPFVEALAAGDVVAGANTFSIVWNGEAGIELGPRIVTIMMRAK